jgi:hypothetical protein
MKLPRAARRLGLVLAGLLVGLGLAEGVARVAPPDAAADLLFDAPGNVPTGMYVADPELGHSPNPGFVGTLRSLGYAVPIRFNTLGLRGPEVGPSDGTRPRWLVVGDSFTLAAQVPEADTFVGRLAGAGIEAWNAGVDGYSTWHARIRYNRAVDTLQPEGVLLVYFLGNDPQDDERFSHGMHMMQGTEPWQPLPAFASHPLSGFLARHSYLYGHAHVAWRRRSVGSGEARETAQWKQELGAFTRGGSQQLSTLLDTSSAPALASLRDAARQRGDRLVVAVAPPAFEVLPARLAATFGLVGLDPATADVDQPARAVHALLARLGIAGCDLVEPLRRAAATGRTLYFTYDGHWTADGHAVVAEALAACLGGSAGLPAAGG